MKRIQPKRAYDNDSGYPVADGGLGTSRRGFLKAALGTGAATGAAIFLGGCPGTMPRPRPPGGVRRPSYWERKTIWLPERFVFCPGGPKDQAVTVRGIIAATTDSSFAAFLCSPKELHGISSRITSALKSIQCVRQTKGLRSKVRRRVARELAAYYRVRTRRAVSLAAVRIRLLK